MKNSKVMIMCFLLCLLITTVSFAAYSGKRHKSTDDSKPLPAPEAAGVGSDSQAAPDETSAGGEPEVAPEEAGVSSDTQLPPDETSAGADAELASDESGVSDDSQLVPDATSIDEQSQSDDNETEEVTAD